MSTREALGKLLEAMPEERVREVLDFAVFLQGQEEQSGWRRFGQAQLARAYGPDEPEYTLAEVKQENRP